MCSMYRKLFLQAAAGERVDGRARGQAHEPTRNAARWKPSGAKWTGWVGFRP